MAKADERSSAADVRLLAPHAIELLAHLRRLATGHTSTRSKSSARWDDEHFVTSTWIDPPDSEWERVGSDRTHDPRDFVKEMKQQGYDVGVAPQPSSETVLTRPVARNRSPMIPEDDIDLGDVEQFFSWNASPNSPSDIESQIQREDAEHRLRGYLSAARDGDEAGALQRLAETLRERPHLLWHPWVRARFMHLLGSRFGAAQTASQCEQTLVGLIRSWARGMTGRSFRVGRGGRRGKPSKLFPAYDDDTREGYYDHLLGHLFRSVFDFLKDTVTRQVNWQEKRSHWTQLEQENADEEQRTDALEDVVHDLKAALETVSAPTRTRFIPTTPIDEQKIREIVRRRLERKERNPTERVARELLALFKFWARVGTVQLTPSLIRSTLRTLRANEFAVEFIRSEQSILPDGRRAIRSWYRVGRPPRTR